MLGEAQNAIHCAAGHKLRKLLVHLRRLFVLIWTWLTDMFGDAHKEVLCAAPQNVRKLFAHLMGFFDLVLECSRQNLTYCLTYLC